MGAGTSGRLGVLDAAECPPTFGVPQGMVIGLIAGGEKAFIKAIEGAEDSRELGRSDLIAHRLTAQDLVIGIAASGRTPYVLGGLEYAHEVGCRTAAIACNIGSAIGKAADLAIEVNCGPEVLTGSTRLKSGTAQKLILNMISTASMVRSGKAYQNLMVDVMQTNEKLHTRAENIVMDATGVERSEARSAIDEAGGSVKCAITMLLAGCSAAEAAQRLTDAGGHVRAAVVNPISL
jgi:N-acetylmuramic acid 6-phosphate etherase